MRDRRPAEDPPPAGGRRAPGRPGSLDRQSRSAGNNIRLRADLRGQRERALRMMREHLRELAAAIPDRALELRTEPLVQICADGLRQTRVGDIAHQQMLEPVPAGLVALPVLEHETGAAKRRDRRSDVEPGHERGDLARTESLAGDRRRLHRPPLVVAEAIEPRGEQRVDALGHAHIRHRGGRTPPVADPRDPTVVDEHPQELLTEERISL